jgi:outer membrane protein assembly factor BamB
MRRIEAAFFILGISFMTYLYGVASTKERWFPTNFVADGWRAAKALKEVWESEVEGLPPGAIEWTDTEPTLRQLPDPAQTKAPNPPDDLVLVTGGPYELTNLCPELGCLAWLMDRHGVVYHAWPIDPEVQWGETLSGYPRRENITPIGTHVYDNGDLLVTFQGRNTFPFGVGVAKFDRNGKVLWQKEINAHHWLDVGDDGLIYLAVHRLRDSPIELGDTDHRLICEDGKIYEDFVVILDRDGRVIEDLSLLDAYVESGYAGLLERTRSDCDPLHLNDVRVLKAELADAYPAFTAGDLMVSTNAVNAVAVIDRSSRTIKWLTSGTMMSQHNPRFAGDNRILVFDNRGGTRIGGKGGSRIIAIEVGSQHAGTIFPPPGRSPSLDFYTDVSGHFDLDRVRSRALVVLSLQGRIVEVDLKSGRVLWEYANIHEIGDYLQANGEEASSPYALFSINGAYYAGQPAFLKEPRSSEFTPDGVVSARPR